MQRIISLFLLCLWPLLTGLAVSPSTPLRQRFSVKRQASAVVTPEAREEWLGIYQKDKKVGYLQRRLVSTNTGYNWEEHWWLTLQVLNTSHLVHTEARAYADRSGALTGFSLWSVSAGVALYITAKVVDLGAGHQEVRGEAISEGTITPFTAPLQAPLLLPQLSHMAQQVSFQSGTVKQFSVFNPLSLRVDLVSFMRIGPETLVLNGQPQTVTKVVTFIGGTPLHGWWDQEGRILKEEAAPGLVLLRESRDEAISGDWQEHAMQVPVSTVKVDNSAKE